MKKSIIVVLVFVFALSTMAQNRPNDCWDGTIAESYDGGDGSFENPYQIANPQQLALLAQQTNFGIGGDAYYVLTDNICLNENLNVNPYNWIPIGCVVDTVPFFFTGHFDGNKMTVSGLYYQDENIDAVVGLFGCTNGAEIQNVSLSNCRVTGSKYAGTLVGCAGLTNISDCYVDDASVTCEAEAAGGLVGFLGLPYGVNQNSYDTCHIVNCHVGQDVTVNGKFSGGLVGEIAEFLLWGPSVPSVVSNCTSNAVIMGSRAVGGLIGFMRNGKMESCRCWNAVYCSQCAGGMVGMGINVNFTDCQNGTSVTGNYQSGGMAGELYGGNILNCENYGWIYGGGGGGISRIGGMVGRFQPDPLLGGSPCENFIRNCHNHGEITGSSDEAGGIVGFAEGCGIEKLFIVDCSNTGIVHNNEIWAGGILGKSNGYVMRILNVYNTATIGAKGYVGGIVGELSLSSDVVINAYSTGELLYEIENYLCPRGTIVGRATTIDQFNSCYWLATDEYGSNGQGPELENSSAFTATTSPSVWQLDTSIHNTSDLLTALNTGAEEIENAFPNLGELSRWREDTELSNGGFPLFGHQWPNQIEETKEDGVFCIYPNPTNCVLFVETQGLASLPTQTYRITNITGQILLFDSLTSENQQIDISSLPNGMYFITLNGTTRKFVINR